MTTPLIASPRHMLPAVVDTLEVGAGESYGWKGIITYTITPSWWPGAGYAAPQAAGYSGTDLNLRLDFDIRFDGDYRYDPGYVGTECPPLFGQYLILGGGGTLPVSPNLSAPWNSWLELSPETDAIASLTVRRYKGATFPIDVGPVVLGVSYKGIGASIELDIKETDFINVAGTYSSEVTLEHIIGWEDLGFTVEGVYVGGGWIEMGVGIDAHGSIEREGGTLTFRAPFTKAYHEGVFSTTEESALEVTIPAEYVRSHALPRPDLALEVKPMGNPAKINVGEHATIKAKLTNRSKLAQIMHAKATLSIGDCLVFSSNEGPIQWFDVPIGVAPDNKTAPWTAIGEAGGKTKPGVVVEYSFEHGNSRDTVAYGPWIEVNDSAFEGSISGQVSDVDTAAPIRGARMVLSPDGMQTTSEVDGSYSFVDVVPGRYELTASARGWIPAALPVDVSSGADTSLDVQLRGYPYVGNRRTREIHVTRCAWVDLMVHQNQAYFEEIEEALRSGYNGCRYCLSQYDTG